MADASQSNVQIDHASSVEQVPQSDFKVYLEQHPEMTAELMKVLIQMYQDPVKESEAAA